MPAPAGWRRAAFEASLGYIVIPYLNYDKRKKLGPGFCLQGWLYYLSQIAWLGKYPAQCPQVPWARRTQGNINYLDVGSQFSLQLSYLWKAWGFVAQKREDDFTWLEEFKHPLILWIPSDFCACTNLSDRKPTSSVVLGNYILSFALGSSRT